VLCLASQVEAIRSWLRNIDGEIIGGQQVRGFHPRTIDLAEPLRRDISEYLLAVGIRSGLLFPRRDGKPWRSYGWKNWRRRIRHEARSGVGIDSLPPYDLRHAFASLQIRASMSVPELAEQMGHAPAGCGVKMKMPGFAGMARPGLEPGTPRFSVVCSTN